MEWRGGWRVGVRDAERGREVSTHPIKEDSLPRRAFRELLLSTGGPRLVVVVSDKDISMQEVVAL